MSNKKRNKSNKIKKPNNFIVGLVLVTLLIVGIFQAGIIGGFINSLIVLLFGNFSLFIYAFLICICSIICLKSFSQIYRHLIFHITIITVLNIYFIWSLIYFVINTDELSRVFYNIDEVSTTPGNLGLILNKIGFLLFGVIGSIIISIVLFSVSIFLYKKHLKKINYLKNHELKFKNALRKKESVNENLDYTQTLVDTSQTLDQLIIKNSKTVKNFKINETVNLNGYSNFNQTPNVELLIQSNNYKSTLQKYEKEAKIKGDILVTTLKNFKLNVKILNIVVGPAVTRYELEPESGVKVSKFKTLTNDIALALACQEVRIEAPIAKMSAVGIEVANDEIMMIRLREVLEDKQFSDSNILRVGLGKDIRGNSCFLDINKTPHLLVAGSTGSGKSVCINAMVISLLLRATPDELKMVMIDPKKVELAPYNDIPHLLYPVVTDSKKASVILNKMVAEMEYRYELFSKTNTRNIESYNKFVESSNDFNYMKIPFIVIIIDELADLMMVASNEVETSIARLAQMARAAGMHLIVATQRPSADVITGLIKSNIPTRISFSVSSAIDSRTILDKGGAEKLLGRGDMLLSNSSNNELTRIQGAYVEDDEINLIVSWYKKNYGESNDQAESDFKLIDEEVFTMTELDEYYEDVKNDVIKMQKASAAYIQRTYKVGYNRAKTILQQLEDNNVISAHEGTKARKVLISSEDDED